jgi:hypothetical protein
VLEAPRAVAAPPAEGEREAAVVTPSFAEGSLLLRGSDGKVVRLAWEPREGGAMPSDRRRAVPPGEYALIGYRIVERARDGKVWHVSASAPKIATLDLRAGATTVEIDPTIEVAQRFDGRAIGMALRGEKDAGLTVYADGKRIRMRYRVLDGEGRELASGDVRYG